jgi:hypothetical protein
VGDWNPPKSNGVEVCKIEQTLQVRSRYVSGDWATAAFPV